MVLDGVCMTAGTNTNGSTSGDRWPIFSVRNFQFMRGRCPECSMHALPLSNAITLPAADQVFLLIKLKRISAMPVCETNARFDTFDAIISKRRRGLHHRILSAANACFCFFSERISLSSPRRWVGEPVSPQFAATPASSRHHPLRRIREDARHALVP